MKITQNFKSHFKNSIKFSSHWKGFRSIKLLLGSKIARDEGIESDKHRKSSIKTARQVMNECNLVSDATNHIL